MRISAKVDYALRACTELAVAGDGPTKGDRIAAAQAIPIKFLENILSELRNAGIVATQRGVEGGYWLARPAEQITLAEVMRALEGPLANVRGHRPETLAYEGSARALVGALDRRADEPGETTIVADLARVAGAVRRTRGVALEFSRGVRRSNRCGRALMARSSDGDPGFDEASSAPKGSPPSHRSRSEPETDCRLAGGQA